MAALILLAGCGGGGGHHGGGSVGRGTVTGLVVDANGDPVRGAAVYADGGVSRQTTTDASGAYVLTDVSALDLDVRATVTTGDTTYRGVNLARVFDGESTPNVNIAVYPASSLTSLSGQVRDGGGRVLRGARVSARPTTGGILSSESTLTDRDGRYTLDDLSVGVEYRIVASGVGFGDSSTTKTIAAGATDADRTQNLTLGGATSTAPAAPTGLRAVAITSGGAPTSGARSARRSEAIEAVRRLRDPQRAARLAKRKVVRDTSLGSPISIDVTWDDYPTSASVLPTGTLVFRNETPGVDNGYLLSDPLASLFSDNDVNFTVGTPYDYTLEAVSTGFEAGSNVGRSAPSATVRATPLDDLVADFDPTGTTLRWTAVPGATRYTVYVYLGYPTLNSSANLVGDPIVTSGTSVPVSNAGYYYLVVGQNADDTAETYSDILTRQI